MNGTVENSYGEANLLFNVDIENVNDPPVILRTAGDDIVNISETALPDSRVTTFSVNDPDVSIPGLQDQLSLSLIGMYKTVDIIPSVEFEVGYTGVTI